MRRFTASVLSVALLLLAVPPPASAAGDKELLNMKGRVSYQLPPGAVQPIATHASAALQDNAYAITGKNSLGGIDLPDSSTVLVGSDSKVQLGFFNQSDIANAKFVIYQGKVRFAVMHPKGAKANYTFQTPTAQIAVRGTQGDISVNGSQMQVNVYAVSNPALPVQVTLANGQVFTLAAGQTLTVTVTGAAISASVSAVSQSSFASFSEFGAPLNASTFGITVVTTATGAAAATTAAAAVINVVTAVIGAVLVNTAVHTIQHTLSHPPAGPPAPGPTPPSSTSVPIVIH